MFALAADLLTLCRVVAAGILIWLGATCGAASLPAAVAVTLVAWTSDQLDGWAARRASTATRLGRFDFAVDAVYYAGILLYVALAGFVPPALALMIAALAAAAWLVTRRKALVVACLRMVDLLCLAVLFVYQPWLSIPVLMWLGVSGLVYRRRLAQRTRLWWTEVTSVAKTRGNR